MLSILIAAYHLTLSTAALLFSIGGMYNAVANLPIPVFTVEKVMRASTPRRSRYVAVLALPNCPRPLTPMPSPGVPDAAVAWERP